KEIGVKLNAPVNEDDLQKGRQKIIDSYQSKGFTDIAVDFRVEPIDESRGTARVIYTANEGVKGAVRRIRFEGNEHFNERILRKQMKTRAKTMFSFIDKVGRIDQTIARRCESDRGCIGPRGICRSCDSAARDSGRGRLDRRPLQDRGGQSVIRGADQHCRKHAYQR